MRSNMLSIKNVSYCYSGRNIPTLKNISIDINKQEMLLIAGRTGCGKSTLIKVINGLLIGNGSGKFSGEVTCKGFDILTLTPEEMGLLVGTVYQSPDDQLFAMTVEDEVGFVLENHGIDSEIIKEEVARTLKRVGLKGFAKRSIHALSGGQRQRLALASVLINKPQILILDEPVSQMNPVGVKEFLGLLKELNEVDGITIIVVEHRVHELAKYFPRLVVMYEGNIIYDGDINKAWGKVGDEIKYGLREPQNVKLCRKLALSRLTNETDEVISLIREECCIDTIKCDEGEAKGAVSKAVLEAKDVCYCYPGVKQNTLHNVNFTLAQGETVALMGYNGAGKSTLFNLIAGLSNPISGTLTLLGGKVADNAHQLGFLRQDPDLMLLADTVTSEIHWHNKNTDESQIIDLMKRLDLADKANDFPLALSKGQRLRVVLAALLARQPKLLLLDEPTTGQDQQSMLDIKNIISDYTASECTVFFCTHDVELAAEIADRVFLMVDGTLLKIGTPHEVLGDKNLLLRGGLSLPPMLRISEGLKIEKCVTLEEVTRHVSKTIVGRN
jgi:energy-coupling factor transport system ATP-binding protein